MKRPALLFANLKGQRDLYVVKVIPAPLAEIFEDYLDCARIASQETHPLWVSEWEYFDTLTGEKISRARYQYVYRDGRYRARVRAEPAMDEGSARYALETVLRDFTGRDTPHAARKLAFQLAPQAAAIHLAEGGAGPYHLLQDLTPGHILIDHRLSSLAAIYGDIAELNSPARQEVSFVVMQRIWELLYGDRGATMTIDAERIRAAQQCVRVAELQLEASQAEAARLTAEIRELQTETHPAQQRLVSLRSTMRDLRAVALEHGAAEMTEAEFRRLVLLGQELDEERENTLRLERQLVECRDTERGQASRLTAAVAETRNDLAAATAARIPLPEPVEEEPDIAALLDELADQSRERGDEADDLLTRRLMTLHEYAEAMETNPGTLHVHVWKAAQSSNGLRYAAADTRNLFFQPIETILVSAKNGWRFIDWDALDKTLYTPSQVARLKAILLRPFQNARWAAAAEEAAASSAPSKSVCAQTTAEELLANNAERAAAAFDHAEAAQLPEVPV